MRCTSNKLNKIQTSECINETPTSEQEIKKKWGNEFKNPLLSVCFITYNHKKFIRHALNSVLSQQTNFPFEVIIGEDESSDGTREIVIEYQKSFPNIIKVLHGDRKNVIHVNGRPTGRRNLLNTLAKAKGKYIAYLEGDDYWIDRNKLQEQVDLMELGSDISICGHWVYNVESNSGEILSTYGERCPTIFGVTSALAGAPLHPNSWVFRNFDISAHKSYQLLHKLPAGDDPLMLMILSQGSGYCVNKYMSVYRIHRDGVWTSLSDSGRLFQMLQFQLNAIKIAGARYSLVFLVLVSYNFFKFMVSLFLYSSKYGLFSVYGEIKSIYKKQELLSISDILIWIIISIIAFPLLSLMFIFKDFIPGAYRNINKLLD